MLDKVRNDPKHSDKLQICHMCKSLGGADIKLLTITDQIDSKFTY